jgi:hypothetical protein
VLTRELSLASNQAPIGLFHELLVYLDHETHLFHAALLHDFVAHLLAHLDLFHAALLHDFVAHLLAHHDLFHDLDLLKDAQVVLCLKHRTITCLGVRILVLPSLVILVQGPQ